MGRVMIFIVLAIVIAIRGVTAQTYHEDDKEGLRMFLRQPSAEDGKINAEQLGLSISDTLDWQDSEAWVEKMKGLFWNNQSPKRLVEVNASNTDADVSDILGNRSIFLAGTLDAGKWQELTALDCSVNKLIALDVSANMALTSLTCRNNQLTALDVNSNVALKQLHCSENELTSLDVSANRELTLLFCTGNQLSDLDVCANTALTHLYCDYNQLTALDLSANLELINLQCNHNQLSALNVSANTAIRSLDCNDNLLTVIDLNANTALRYLDCSGNRLPVLDVSANTVLEILYCQNNRIGTLDLKKNTALLSIDCSENRLTALDVGEYTVMSLSCYNNHLPLSDLFAASKIVVNLSTCHCAMVTQRLGEQYLLPRSESIGDEIDYSGQNIFDGINTLFIITKEYGLPATPSDYQISDGKIIFTHSGHYTVSMSNEAIVSDNDYPAIVFVDIEVGNVDNRVVTQDVTTIKAYPNPAHNQIQITNYKIRNEYFEIFNQSGQMVMRGKLQGETTTLNIGTFERGVYYLRINNEVVKFLKH